ncbi:FtsX-like permease family protein [Kineosporia succinea]|uniref:ABC transport system permease protein n=1 Tax=Kineosporia succinea TaxID=84632 RepID=A0ABT9P1L7_9ACTN|nr:FtsX-like permease family protein [Kineosporia succinea]MDP9825980.1 putative ABC transport system permease protein [Kineosporia succinea]
MFYVARKMARRRIASLVAVTSAVVGGAALITATGVLGESGFRSHAPVTRLAGADILIGADQTFRQDAGEAFPLPERASLPGHLVAELNNQPGVVTAAGDVSFPAAVLTPGGQPVSVQDASVAGHGWSITAFVGPTTGTAPSGAGQIGVGQALAEATGLGIGDTTRVVADGVTRSVRVTSVVSGNDAGIYFADSEVAAPDLVALKVASGEVGPTVDALRATYPDLTVAGGDERGDVLDPELGAARTLLTVLAGSMAGITLVLVGFVVAGALGVSIDNQRRELALLRAVGATPRQIRRLAAGQATVAAVVALVPGLALGYLLADQAGRMLVGLGMLPDDLPLSYSPLPALGTAALLLLTVQVAARGAAWRVSRRPATEAVAESRTEAPAPGRVRNGAGLLLIVAGTGLAVMPLVSRSVVAISGSALAGIIASIGLALAGPTQLHRLTARLPRPSSPTGWLAVSNLHGYSRRFAGAVTTLGIAVVFVTTYAFTQTSLMRAQSDDTRTGTTAQYSLSAPALGGLPGGVLGEVRSLDGVRGAAEVRNTTLLRRYSMLGDDEVESSSALVLGAGASSVLDLGVTDGTLDDLTGDTIAAGASTRLEVGDEATLYLGDGTPATARVVAVYDRDLGFGPLVASPDLVAGHLTNGLVTSVLVSTSSPDALSAYVSTHPGLVLTDPDATSTGPRGIPADVWINLAAIGVLLGYLLLGIANKLVAATTARRAEFATLRLNGSTVRQIRAMTRREAGLITVTAVTAGLGLAALPMLFLGLGLLGRPYPAGPVWLVPVTVAVVALIGFTSIELATRHALRLPPAEALAERD